MDATNLKQAWRQAAAQLVPPLLWRKVRRLGGIRFVGRYPSWTAAQAAAGGYDAPAILARVTSATRQVLQGKAAFERDGCLFDREAYRWPLVAALLWSSARSGGCVRVLDYGGSLGSTFHQMRRFLAGFASVEWSVVEQPHYVRAGRDEFERDGLKFFESVDECAARRRIATVLLSGVLQYLPDPWQTLDSLARIDARDIIIDRTLFSVGGEERICLQQVPPSIVRSSYPCRFLSLERLRATLAPAYEETLSFDPDLDRAPAGGFFGGRVFTARDAIARDSIAPESGAEMSGVKGGVP